MDTAGQRLRQILKHYKLTQIALSQKIRVTRSYISNLVSDTTPLTTSIIMGLINCFPDLNTHWLLTGKGVMILNSSDDTGDKMNEPIAVYGKPEEPFEMLRVWKESFEQRIKDLEAEVARIRVLQEGEGKGRGEI